MPFDLFVSRASTLDAMRGKPSSGSKPGLLGRLFSKTAAAPARPPAPITSDEFDVVMAGAEATPKGDHVYWVSYPDGDPWFGNDHPNGGHDL